MKIETIAAEEGETQVDMPAPYNTQSLTPGFARNGLDNMDMFHEEMLDLREALLDIESFGGP
ncbi:MAG: hypothetical protein OXD48_07290 [Litoreibacter sp.]|nr:hypothetical protein [Litoreibacter sp.]